MSWSRTDTPGKVYFKYEGYNTLTGVEWRFSLSNPDNLWATGTIIAATVLSGDDVEDTFEANDKIIDLNIYNPYAVDAYLSGDDLYFTIPSWAEYCSGWLNNSILETIDTEPKSGLSESEVYALLYKFIGRMNVYTHALQYGEMTFINITGLV